MLPLERAELVSTELAEMVADAQAAQRRRDARQVPAQPSRRGPTSTTPSTTRAS